MADQPVTREKLINADKDVQVIEDFIKKPKDETVTTRFGDEIMTLKGLEEEVKKSGGYFKRYTTLEAANADIANIPVNSVVKVTSEVNGGDYEKAAAEATSLTKSPFDPVELAKNYADANWMFKPKTYAAAVDFNNLTEYGVHTFLSGSSWENSTNRPDQGVQWGHVLVLPTLDNILTQVAFMGNVTKTLAMRLRGSSGTWQSWGYFHSFDKIAELIKADFNSYLKPQRLSTSKNLFDPSNVTVGKEIYSNGVVQNHAQGAVSGLIYCIGKSSLYISGLQANSGNRYYRFLDKSGQIVSVGYFASGKTEGLITIPENAGSFQISVKQRTDDALDVSNVQIEYSSEKTDYVAFVAGEVVYINDMLLYSNPIKMNKVASGKNLFDKSMVLNGYEVYSDGRVLAQASSITSPIISVKGLSSITISGLEQNVENGRYYVFKDSNNTVLSVSTIDRVATSVSIPVPTEADTFQFSVKQRSTATPDLNIVQVESGTNATAYEEYKRGFSELNGVPVVAQSTASQAAQTSRAFGAKYLMFGDSITQTSNVDTGVVTDTAYRSNWPKFAKGQLQMSDYKNYARSGASFREYVGQEDWQKISHQVQTAIINSENPDVIVLACGTNDANTILGTYETAMSKNIVDLDLANTAEAMRWSLYKIKENFPNAVCFYCTQLQRASVETSEREDANNLMVKLAKRYGFNIIDCMNESGIVRDFEVVSGEGRYLSDGLHPNIAGQQVQANLIASQIIERMMY